MESFFRVRTLLVSLTVVICALQVSCSNKSFTSVENNGPALNPGGDGGGGGDTGGTTGQNCRDVLHTTNLPIKLLFMVDVSGSNLEADDGSAGSDPSKSLRGGSITKFFSDYVRYSHFSWGFYIFNNTTAQALIGPPAFSNNAYAMQNAINTFYNYQDQGTTPYIAPIQAAKNAISADSGRTNDTKYIVVFLSDGLPVPLVDTATLVSEVQKVLNAAPGQVTFNTIYYGPYNPTASGRLSSMAQAGNGIFLDTNANPNGRNFQIDHVINVPGVECTPTP